MAARRRARLSLTGSGGQLPLDRLVEPRPPPTLSDEPLPLPETIPDAAINARRARWIEERARFERAKQRREAVDTEPASGAP